MHAIHQKMDSVEMMKEARNNATSTFMKFTQAINKAEHYAYCFYEGEDGKYYDPRIRNYFGGEFFTFKVGNKTEVLSLVNIFQNKPEYSTVTKMFFVDRDFEFGKTQGYPNIYETPCYSIENFYASSECFGRILQSEFHLNGYEEDYLKCLEDFSKRLKEFIEIISEFNSLVYLRRKKSASNSDFKFGKIKTTHLVNISINLIEKNSKYEEKIANIKEVLNLSESECETSLAIIREYQDKAMVFRGKNQLQFLTEIIRDLRALHKKGEYFQEQKDSVSINLTGNILSELSAYADTPKCLDMYLKTCSMEHKLQANG